MELDLAFRSLCAGFFGFAFGLIMLNIGGNNPEVREPAVQLIAQQAMRTFQPRSFMQPVRSARRFAKVYAAPARDPVTEIAPGEYTVEAFMAREKELDLDSEQRDRASTPPQTTQAPRPQQGASTLAPASSPALSPQQQAFLEQKKKVMETREQTPASAPASTSGLSPEQMAFMERRRTAAAPASRSGLSPEQTAFLERRKAQQEKSKSYADAQSEAAPPPVREPPLDDLPASPPKIALRYGSIAPPPPPTIAQAPPSPEQQAAVERRTPENVEPAFQAPAPPLASAEMAGLSPEQIAFMERKKRDKQMRSKSSPAPAPAPVRQPVSYDVSAPPSYIPPSNEMPAPNVIDQTLTSHPDHRAAFETETRPTLPPHDVVKDKTEIKQTSPVSSPLGAVVQGGHLKVWSYKTPAVKRVQVDVNTEGRPLDANVELWAGPDNTPHKLRVYAENGEVRPFSTVIETPRGPNAVAVSNTKSLDFPAYAKVEAVPADVPLAEFDEKPVTVQGGALKNYEFDRYTDSVKVLLKTNGNPINARIEVLQGPTNNKQIIELYTENGHERPFYAVLPTPGIGHVVQIFNTGPIEFPFTANVATHTTSTKAFSYEDLQPVIN